MTLTYDPNSYEETNYKISFNIKSFFSVYDTKYIKYLIYNLYETNCKFKQLMKNYDTICVVKNLHYDNESIKNSLHFNAYLFNKLETCKTKSYHFYILNNKIYRITELVDIL